MVDRITVSSVDGTATQDIIVTITGINNAPVITSTNTSQVTTAVGTSTAVYTVTSTDVDENNILTYSISGGADASLCNIGSSTGAVTFKANPTVGIYYITVKVADENSDYVEKEITIIVTSETAANHSALTEAVVENITQDSVVVGDVTVSDLTTTANVEVPDGSTLTVASGDHSGILSGNGSVVVTGTVDFTKATLDNFNGAFTVSSGILTIAATAGTIITLASNNDGSTNASVKISSTNTTTATTVSTALYASSDGTIENTNTEQPVVFTGPLYKPSTRFTLVGLIKIIGAILGKTPDDDTEVADSDIYVGDVNQGASVTYTSAGTYTYNGATLIETGSTLTFENGGVNVPNSDFVVNGTLVLDYSSGVDASNSVYSLELNGALNINIYEVLTPGNTYTLLNYGSKTGLGSAMISYSAPNMGDIMVVGSFSARSYDIAVSSNTIPASNVCFPAKTPVLTNRGYVNIEEIDAAVHTIRNQKIVAITKTVAHDKNLVRIAKHALGKNYPEKTTLISQNHKVFCKGQMVKAKHLVGENENVTLVPYNGQVLYNVLLAEHEKMQVNNLIVETLHPEHKVAKLYRFFKNVDASHHGKLIALFNKKDQEHRKSTF